MENEKAIYKNGNFKITEGPSLRNYPADIRDKDHVYYIETPAPYAIRFDELLEILCLLLLNKVRPNAYREYESKVINWLNTMRQSRGLPKRWSLK